MSGSHAPSSAVGLVLALCKIALGGALPDTTSERFQWALGRYVVIVFVLAKLCADLAIHRRWE